MARQPRQRRFECYVEFWTTPEQFEAFSVLAANGLLTKSDHYRQAFDLYLRGVRALPAPRPEQPNGQHHQERAHGL